MLYFAGRFSCSKKRVGDSNVFLHKTVSPMKNLATPSSKRLSMLPGERDNRRWNMIYAVVFLYTLAIILGLQAFSHAF
jgi:hypothetical protein